MTPPGPSYVQVRAATWPRARRGTNSQWPRNALGSNDGSGAGASGAGQSRSSSSHHGTGGAGVVTITTAPLRESRYAHSIGMRGWRVKHPRSR